jgi:hypothetical protein
VTRTTRGLAKRPGSGDLLAKAGQLRNQERPALEERLARGVPLLAALDPLPVAQGGSSRRAPGIRAATASDVARGCAGSLAPLRKTIVGTEMAAAMSASGMPGIVCPATGGA